MKKERLKSTSSSCFKSGKKSVIFKIQWRQTN